MFTWFYFRFPTDGPRKSDEFTLVLFAYCEPVAYCYIFSVHFTASDYTWMEPRRFLKSSAVPSVFQGVSKTEDEESERTMRYSESYLQQLCFRTPTNLRNLTKDHFRPEINIISLLNLLFFYMK